MYVNTVYFHDHDAFSPGLVQLLFVRLFFTSKTWSKLPGGAITILKNMSSSMGRIIPYSIWIYIYIWWKRNKLTNVWNHQPAWVLHIYGALNIFAPGYWHDSKKPVVDITWYNHWGYQLLHLIPGLASNLRRSNLRRSIVSGLVQLCLRGKEGSQNELKRVKLQDGKLLHMYKSKSKSGCTGAWQVDSFTCFVRHKLI